MLGKHASRVFDNGRTVCLDTLIQRGSRHNGEHEISPSTFFVRLPAVRDGGSVLALSEIGANRSDLTLEQEGIATAPADQRILVIAGAGTGKTHVLIERLATLADQYALSLADEVLVMSFSRAAVGEIRRRMRQRTGTLPYGAVVTFDSFASRLLAHHDSSTSWTSKGFDGRIEAALRLIATSEDAQQELRRIRHVIVDEVQDLVGVRCELVQSILEHSGNGFTLFSDPAQGIYNFQATNPLERQLGSLVFLDWVTTKLSGSPTRVVTLGHNFRYQTNEARIAEWAGEKLNSAVPNYPQILEALERNVLDLNPIRDIGDLILELEAISREGSLGGTIGILCNYNFEVLRISQRLAQNGVVHHYQRSATDRPVPGWVGQVLRSCDSTSLGKRHFEGLATKHNCIPENAWALLKRFDPARNSDNIDVSKLQERIRLGDIPADFTPTIEAPIVVSTIHRAKGLEFDRVVLVEPSVPLTAEPEFVPERARQLYVALTRARQQYGFLARRAREYADQRGNPDGVWVVRGIAKHGRRYVKELEVRGDHAWKQDPAGVFGFRGNAIETQEYIEREVKPFDSLLLRRIQVDSGKGSQMYYVMEHNGHRVGVVDIGWILWDLSRPKFERNWPSTIENILVESVDTVAGTSAAGTRAGLGSSGIWLRVRPYGLGKLKWG